MPSSWELGVSLPRLLGSLPAGPSVDEGGCQPLPFLESFLIRVGDGFPFDASRREASLGRGPPANRSRRELFYHKVEILQWQLSTAIAAEEHFRASKHEDALYLCRNA